MIVEFRVAWWWHLYAFGLVLTSKITGLEPDWEKVEHMMFLAIRLRVPSGRWSTFRKLLSE